MNNVTLFLELYKSFESWAVDKYKVGKMKDLEDFFDLARYRSQLNLYRSLRNLLSHNAVLEGSGKSSLSISDTLIEEFRACIAELQSLAVDRSILLNQICTRSKGDSVKLAMKEMYDRDLSNLPIMEEGKVIGVFSERTVFELACSGLAVTEEMTFADIMDFIELKSNPYVPYTFVPKSLSVPDVLGVFAEAKYNNYRLDIVLITEDGTPDSELLGMISAWDMAAV